MKTKRIALAFLTSLAAVCLLLGALFVQGGGYNVRAQSTPAKVHVETIQNFHGVKATTLDINLTDMDGSITPQEGDAFVLRIDNNNTAANTVFSFRVNGTYMTGTSSDPTYAYTYKDGSYVASYSFGSYAAGYIGGGDYNYLVIPASNFSTLSALTSFSIAHRSAKGGNESHKNLNYDIYGLYLVSGYTAKEAIETSSLITLWTPDADNFSVTFVDNQTDNAADYVTATYSPAYAFSASATEAQGGSVRFDKTQFNSGDSVVITVTPDAGYELATLIVNSADVTASVSDGSYTAADLTGDLTVSATFRQTFDFSATVEYGSGGTVTLDKEAFNSGDSVVITVTPDEGYDLISLTVNGADVTNSVSNGRYTAENLTGDLIVEAVFAEHFDYSASAQPAQGGTVTFSRTQFNAGADVVVQATPDAGYELAALTVNGTDVTAQTAYGRYTASSVTGNLTASAVFRKASIYYAEDGAITSIYNTRRGTVYSPWDAVNVATVEDMSSYSEYQMVGVTATGMNAAVTAGSHLAVRVYNLDAGWRTFYVMVNGGLNSSSGSYYMVDRLGNVTQKTGTGIITEKYTRFENATFDLGTTATEGFSGLLIIPLANYGGGEIERIESVSVYTGARDKSYARFNVGAMWVLDSFDGITAPSPDEEDAVWTPAQDNWSLYGDTAQFAQAQFLAADDYAIRNVTVSPYYDQYYLTLPQNMIGADGYVDLEALGIKGIAIDVENYNALQTGFAIRIAGSDNVSLTDTTKTLWQTSIASGYVMKVIYESGLVRTRAPAFLPYDESGSFTGTVYISLSSLSFTNIGQGEGGFPTKIQPVLRQLFSKQESDDSVYRANISNIRFITDETPYETNIITMTGIGGVITGTVGDKPVGATSNNNVLNGTPVTFTVTPNAGYTLDYVTYTMNDETVTAALDANGSFTVSVTGDITVLFNCNETAYSITYDLAGGTNNANNRTQYFLSDGKVRLYDPTREGYVFEGWVDENGNAVEEIDASAARNITLTAVWSQQGAGGKGGCGSQADGAALALGIAALAAGAASVVLLRRKRR